MSILDTLKENPLIPLIGVGGALLGGWGGASLGGGGIGSWLLGGLLAVGGLAAGAYAGHSITASQDRSQPTPPLGLRPVSTTPLEPGKVGEAVYKPAVVFSESMVEIAESKINDPRLTSLPNYKELKSQVETYLPIIKRVLPYTKIKLQGTASADGKSFTLSGASISIPEVGDYSGNAPNLVLPMKNGQIDMANPETKRVLKDFMQEQLQRVPEGYSGVAQEVFEELFKKLPTPQLQSNAGPGSDDKTVKLLDAEGAKALLAGAEKVVPGAYSGHGGVPMGKPVVQMLG